MGCYHGCEGQARSRSQDAGTDRATRFRPAARTEEVAPISGRLTVRNRFLFVFEWWQAGSTKFAQCSKIFPCSPFQAIPLRFDLHVASTNPGPSRLLLRIPWTG